MTDEELAARTVAVNQIEAAARATMTTSSEASEREAATAVLRQAGALRRALELWIVERATRAQRASTRVA